MSATPTVFLHQSEERMYLCAHQHKSLTLIFLIPVSSVLNGEQDLSTVKQQVLENVPVKLLKVEEKLSKGWGDENTYHVSGYRYLLVDGDKNLSRASPPGKVPTLSKGHAGAAIAYGSLLLQGVEVPESVTKLTSKRGSSARKSRKNAESLVRDQAEMARERFQIATKAGCDLGLKWLERLDEEEKNLLTENKMVENA